jgi:hypothetical protein
MYPVFGNVYSYTELMNLDLSDSPSLLFYCEDMECVIQDAHVDQESMNSILGETMWCYIQTTHEQIPIFRFVGEDILPYVDMTKMNDGYWVVPKGMKRKMN